jgi:hypothetical protein
MKKVWWGGMSRRSSLKISSGVCQRESGTPCKPLRGRRISTPPAHAALPRDCGIAASRVPVCGFSDFQVSRFSDFKTSRFSNFQISIFFRFADFRMRMQLRGPASRFSDFRICRFSDAQIVRFSDCQILRFPHLQISRFPVFRSSNFQIFKIDED